MLPRQQNQSKKLALHSQTCTILNYPSPSFSLGLQNANTGQLPEGSLPENPLSAEQSREAISSTASDKRAELRQAIDGGTNSPLLSSENELVPNEATAQLEALADLEEEYGLVITRDQVDFTELDRALADPTLSGEQVITAAFAPAIAAMILGDAAKAKLDRRQMLAASGAAAVAMVTGNQAEAANRTDAPAARVRPADPMPKKISYEWHGIEDRDLVNLTPTERMMYELTMTNPAFKNYVTESLVKEHKAMYRNRDIKKWQQIVKDLESDKIRKSFLGEYFAFSGEAVCTPIEGIGPEPREGKEHHGFTFHAYRPERTSDGKFFSEKLTNTSYVLGKGNVPIRNNPYDINCCYALKNFPPEEVEKVLEGLRKMY